jgi:hypothetical protein
MATGLFPRSHRNDDDATEQHATVTEERTADEERTAEQPTTGRAQVDERETVRQRAVADTDTVQKRHPLAFDKDRAKVPAGGAVAPVPEKTVTESDTERTEVVEPSTEREPRRWARTSFAATLSLIVGVCAVLAALSGRLAPVAIAVGAIGLVLSAVGLAAVSRKHVTGHHVALIGLCASIAGIVLGVLAVNRSLPWLDSTADNVGHLRNWLDARLPFMSDW